MPNDPTSHDGATATVSSEPADAPTATRTATLAPETARPRQQIAVTEAPQPPTFDALPLSSELRRAIDDMGYVNPTPVQLAVWQPAAGGVDLVVQARTGTGKTAAFGMPIVDRLVRRSQKAVQALILCPTRELALQVSRELDALGQHRGVETTAIYGGAPMPKQIEAISRGAQVIAGTPGRVLDHLRRGTLDPGQVRTLVLDEADEMLSMGFERELNAIMERLPATRQTLLFSATVPPDIERMARTKLRKPEFITLSGDHIGALEVQHFTYFVTQDKLAAMATILEIDNPESAIIFCNTREATERLAQSLVRAGYDADWLNGDLPQTDRERTMAAAREGRLRFLVATDVAARGIDISNLTHVINFDFPQDAEAYVHRTGRTGRAGRTGTAISLVTPGDVGALYLVRLTYKIRPVERQLPTARDQQSRAEADVVEGLRQTFAPRGHDPEYEALAQRLLTHDEAQAIIAGMLREYLASRPDLPEEAARRRREATPPPRHDPGPEQAPSEHRERPRRERAPRDEPREPRDGAAAGRGRGPRRDEPRGERPARHQATERTDEVPTSPTAREDRPRRGTRHDREIAEVTVREIAEPEVTEPTIQVRVSTVDAPSEPEPPTLERTTRPEPAMPAVDDTDPVTLPRRREARRAVTRKVSTAETSPEQAPAANLDDPAPDTDAPTVELHVNVGRRDGVRPSDIVGALASLPEGSVPRVRLRERYSFLDVLEAHAAAALDALNGQSLAGRTVRASMSQRSGTRKDGPDPQA